MTIRVFLIALLGLVVGLRTVAHAGPALLFEADTGKVFYAEDQDDQWHPASLTKIMTAYLAFAAIKAGKLALDTKITCSEAAHIQPPSKVGLPVGGQITVDLALKALIIKSANDVAVMLAEAISGSEQAFAEEMNATARRLGMTRTLFVNANGLPAPEQVTTARDLAKLSRAIVRDFPEHAHYWMMADMRIGKRRLGTHNGLLKTYDGADGLKTGFICDSGYNVVASATRDGRRLMAVVLGETSGHDRTLRAASLLEHGFQMQGWKQLFNTANVDTLPLPSGAKSVVSIRNTVVSWDCGGRGRARAIAKSRVAAKKARQAAAKARKKSVGEAKEEVAATPAKPAAERTATAKEPPKKASASAVKPAQKSRD